MGSSDHLCIIGLSCFFLSLSTLSSASLNAFFFFFFWSFPLAVVCSYLAAFSCTQHPVCTGAGQTLSLCDAEDISQAITFSAWARYLYNWVLPAVGVRESEKGEEKEWATGRGARGGWGSSEGSVSISTRTPLKRLWEAPQQFFLSVRTM